MILMAMAELDRAGEYIRLRDHYRELSDGELLDLARQPSELTEIAEQALKSEISRRGLKVESAELAARQRPQPPPELDPNDPNYDEDTRLVTIRTVWSREDAFRMQDLLDTAGIPFYMGAEKATSADAVTSNFAEGVDVQIMQIGIPWARLALKDYAPVEDRADENEEVPDEASVRCPKCHSEEIILQETEPVKEGTTPQLFKWKCDNCGHHWEDDGVEPDPPSA